MKGAIAGLALGSIAMTVMMVIWNLVFTPIFMGVSVDTVIPMILPIIVPFNLLKAGINSCVTFLVYKPLSRFLGISHAKTEKA